MVDNRSSARSIVSKVLEFDEEVDGPIERYLGDAPSDLYLGDLTLHAKRFWQDYASIGRSYRDYSRFPCIQRQDGQLSPIDLRQARRDGLREVTGLREPRAAWNGQIDAEHDENIVFVHRDDAVAHLREGMILCLTSRMDSLSSALEGTFGAIMTRVRGWRSPTPGFVVRVTAITPNLRVHVSPTFRRSWRFFASPTSPAVNRLTGGIYEFAVDGGRYPTITPDPATFFIPYGTVTPALAL